MFSLSSFRRLPYLNIFTIVSKRKSWQTNEFVLTSSSLLQYFLTECHCGTVHKFTKSDNDVQVVCALEISFYPVQNVDYRILRNSDPCRNSDPGSLFLKIRHTIWMMFRDCNCHATAKTEMGRIAFYDIDVVDPLSQFPTTTKLDVTSEFNIYVTIIKMMN